MKTIGVLGAGVAGLATAKTLVQKGFEVEIFEARDRIGGVWSNDYHSLRVQMPRSVYEFPDWPWPAGTEKYPSAAAVRDYLTGYANHFSVHHKIRFNTNVVQMEKRDGGGWNVTVESPEGKESKSFDFFVIAPGVFNLPSMPNYPDQKNFNGQILHSTQYKDPNLVKGRDVVIVGFSRSAMAIAVDAVKHSAANVTMVYRTVRWGVPEKVLGLIPTYMLFYARWPILFAPLYIRPGGGARLVQVFKPLVRGFWKFFELLLTMQWRLGKLGLKPSRPIIEDVFSNLYVAPRSFFSMLRNGSIRSELAEPVGFLTNGINLTNEKTLNADTVIFCTGFRQDYPYLPADTVANILESDGLYLYRHMIHPDLPDAAFVGLVQSLNSPMCYAVQAAWVARLARGEISCPDREDQLAAC